MPTVIIPLNEKLTAQERWAQKDAIGHLIRLATGTRLGWGLLALSVGVWAVWWLSEADRGRCPRPDRSDGRARTDIDGAPPIRATPARGDPRSSWRRYRTR
jgi:hypothetical protein